MPLAMIVIAIALGSCVNGRSNEDQEKEILNFITKFESDPENEGKKFIKTESGLHYCIIKEGTGEKAHFGQIIDYVYGARMLKEGDWSIAYTDSDLVEDVLLGNHYLLEGVEEAFTYMNVGSELYAIIPSYLGYGNYSYYTDPYTPWFYWLRLDGIREPNEEDDGQE